MVNDELLLKMVDVMGDNKHLMFLQGQFKNPEKRTKDDGQSYYLGDIRVPRIINDSLYGVSFDVYHICFSTEFCISHKVTDDIIKSFKDNEIIVSLTPNCRVNPVKRDDRTDKYNNINFYVDDIMILNQITKTDNKRKVINL